MGRAEPSTPQGRTECVTLACCHRPAPAPCPALAGRPRGTWQGGPPSALPPPSPSLWANQAVGGPRGPVGNKHVLSSPVGRGPVLADARPAPCPSSHLSECLAVVAFPTPRVHAGTRAASHQEPHGFQSPCRAPGCASEVGASRCGLPAFCPGGSRGPGVRYGGSVVPQRGRASPGAQPCPVLLGSSP